MPALPAPLRPRSRLPLAEVALAAVVGILGAEAARRGLPQLDDGTLGWVGDGAFLALALTWCWRPGGWRFRALIAVGYAGLHCFNADPLPAAALAHLLAAPPADHFMRATGVVLDIPRVSTALDPAAAGSTGVSRKFLVGLESLILDGTRPWDCHATVAVDWRDGPRTLDPGDRVDLVAEAANIAPPRNPGEFDWADFQRRRGVRSELSLRGVADGRVTVPGGPWQPLTLARGVHDWMQRQLGRELGDEPEIRAVVATMLLGLRDHPGLGSLAPMFQRTGTLHFFAIDGLKLGMLAFLLRRVLDAAGLPRPWPGLCVLPLLLGYAMATGLGAASARAVLVAAALVGGEWLDRPPRPLNSLGAAAAALLFFDTNQLFELNFQLSFAVVLAILVLAGPIDRWLRRLIGPADVAGDIDPSAGAVGFGAIVSAAGFGDAALTGQTDASSPWWRQVFDFLRRQVCALTAVAMAAWVGSVPLMALDFHVVSPFSPVANVLTFPLAFTVLALGVFSLAGAVVSPIWVAWMNNANWLAAKGLLALVRACDTVPGGSLAVASPAHWHLWSAPPVVEAVVLDPGRARAGWVRAGGTDWLVDCARPFEYSSRVRPCLEAGAVRRLDGLLLTQDDASHAGAAAICREDFQPVSTLWTAGAPRTQTSRDLRRQFDDAHAPVRFVRRGDMVELAAGVTARISYPPEGASGTGASANRALAVRFDAAGWRVWWMPESVAAARWLLAHERPEELSGDVLVATAPVAAEWLRAVAPRLIVVRAPLTRRETAEIPFPLPADKTLVQEDSGAVTLEIYPDHLDARGFVDGRMITVRK